MLSLLLLSCNLSDKNQINRSQIANLLRDIEFEFNKQIPNQSLEKIMSCFHRDYKHNSNQILSVENYWSKNLTDYRSIKIEDVDIVDLDDDYAEVRFKMTFFNTEDKPTLHFMDPKGNGFMSYFKYENSWKIYGNQRDSESNNRF